MHSSTMSGAIINLNGKEMSDLWYVGFDMVYNDFVALNMSWQYVIQTFLLG